jgi:hypothetical protein
MKKQEIYDSWKDKNRHINISESFADGVMEQIYRYEQKKRKSLFNMRRLVGTISAHPLAQAALVAAGAFTGLIRLVFIIVVILSKGDING